MYSFTVLIMYLAFMSLMFQPAMVSRQVEMNRLQVMATNFMVYRQAVNNYALENSPADGTSVADISLDLPSSYIKMGSWTNVVSGGNIFVWGELERFGGDATALFQSQTLGFKTPSGGLYSPIYGDLSISLPASVPVGDVVSVIGVPGP